MPQVSGILLEITARDRPGRDGNTVYDIRVGAPNAKFGTKITDWNGIAEEFEEGEQVTATFQERDAPNGGKYRNLDALTRGSQPAQEPRSPAQPARPAPQAGPNRDRLIVAQTVFKEVYPRFFEEGVGGETSDDRLIRWNNITDEMYRAVAAIFEVAGE